MGCWIELMRGRKESVREVEEVKEVEEKALRGATENGERLDLYDQTGVPPVFA
jgi:hypothetical protein